MDRLLKHKIHYPVFILLFCLFLFQPNNAYSKERLEITHGPYLVELGEHAVTVIWFTNKECLSWVEYCGDDNLSTFPVWGGYPKSAFSNQNGLIDANSKRHTIRLTGLDPGTVYRYRIVSKQILKYDPYEVIYGDSVVDDIYEFETLNPEKKSFSFGIVTDLHERALVLDTLLQNTPTDSFDMMFYTGDMLNWIGDEERILKGFVDVSVTHFAKEKPFVLVRGNHEARGPNARELFSYFPHSSGNYYHAFSQGNVRFIILDSGEDKPDSHPVYAGLVDFDNYRSEQAEWLRNEVQSEKFKNATYKIVLFHIPPFTGRSGHAGTDLTKKWGRILNDSDIDIVISGHHHRLAKIEPVENKNKFPILILGKDMILKTEVSEKNLSFSIRGKAGELLDEFLIPSGTQ